MKTPRFSWRVGVSAVCPRCTDYSYFTVTFKFKIYEEEFKKLIWHDFKNLNLTVTLALLMCFV